VKNSAEEIKKTYQTDTIVLAKRSFEKNGIKTFFIPVFPNAALRKEIAKNGNKEANIEYKQYFNNVGIFWILNGLQLVIAILSKLFIGGNNLLLGMSIFTTLILIIISIIFLRKAKCRLSNSIWYYNKNVLFNKPS
jgi:hypothetical protein